MTRTNRVPAAVGVLLGWGALGLLVPGCGRPEAAAAAGVASPEVRPSADYDALFRERYAAWSDEDLVTAVEALRVRCDELVDPVAWPKYERGDCTVQRDLSAIDLGDPRNRPVVVYQDGATGLHHRVVIDFQDSPALCEASWELAWLTERCRERNLDIGFD